MARHAALPVIEEVKGPPEPLGALYAIKGRPYPFFLDSACRDAEIGRYSLLGCDPFLVFSSKGTAVTLAWAGGKVERMRKDPFTVLKGLLEQYRTPPCPAGLPMAGGAVGYFSYDMKGLVEKLPSNAADDLGIPECILAFYNAAIIYDHCAGRCHVAGTSTEGRRTLSGYLKAVRMPSPLHPAAARRHPVSNFSKPAYIKAVEKAKDYIRKGDIYQVNLSQRFSARLAESPFDLYCRLRSASPAPFAAYLGLGDVAILSSSPERFLLKKGRRIETRPIKGTRPRGRDKAEDAALERELLASAKDRAEHVMIVDLERNDLGRIAEYGSVKVERADAIERYANVFHMVSTVSGVLRQGIDQVDCLRATFPGGSITGAPKIRSMEIIDELEPVRRSIYTGAIGYLSFDGTMDTSIAIRTIVVKGKDAYFQVGGGIVADSGPEAEYEETLDKAAGMMEALGMKSRMVEAIAA